MMLWGRRARKAAERHYDDESDTIALQLSDVLVKLLTEANESLLAQAQSGEAATDRLLTKSRVSVLATSALMLALDALSQARTARYVEPANSAVNRAEGYLSFARTTVDVAERLGYL